jgi:hypothetical protein
MAVPYPNQFPLHRATFDVEQSKTSIRDNIGSMRHMVYASRRTIADARQAIARADEVLARRLSDHDGTLPRMDSRPSAILK